MAVPMLALLVATLVAWTAEPVAPKTVGAAAAACCYTNDGYAGVCSVVPAKEETCAGILAYLNTPNTAGRTYCNATRVRRGWKNVPCPAPPTPVARAATREDLGAAPR